MARAPGIPRLSEDSRRNLAIFFAGIATAGIASGIYETSFNNFLSDVFQVKATVRGMIEFPREMPGFLVALLSGALVFLGEHRLAVVAAAYLGVASRVRVPESAAEPS